MPINSDGQRHRRWPVGSLAAGNLMTGLRLGVAISTCLALAVAVLAPGVTRDGTPS